MNDKIKNRFQKIKEEQTRLGREVKERTMGYILTALGLVAGLAWNDAIKTIIEYIFPLSSDSILAKVFYAFLVTIIIVFASVYLLKSSEKPEIKK
jgi:septation ring formation regulator EzrA